MYDDEGASGATPPGGLKAGGGSLNRPHDRALPWRARLQAASFDRGQNVAYVAGRMVDVRCARGHGRIVGPTPGGHGVLRVPVHR